MRARKFRVFTHDEGMITTDVDCFLSLDTDGTLNNAGYPTHHVMEWTGFSDIDGIQIFEDDILICNNVIYQLVQELGKAWELRNKKHDQVYFLFNHFDKVSVIGNAFQNPEYIKDFK